MVYPKISVITLTKNNIKELEITVNSLFNQDLNVFIEILIVDGSQDKKDVMSFIHEFKKIKLKPNIKLRYINSFEKKIFGIYPSMNLALNNVNSEYLIFMNSGDIFFDKQSLSLLFNLMNEKKCDLCFGQSLIIGDNGLNWINPSPLVKNINLWCKFFEPIHQSMLIKTSLAKKNKFDVKSPIGADAQWKRSIINKYNYFYLSYPVSRFSLKGISNVISFKNLKVKLKEPSRRSLEKFLEIVKYILYKIGIFGPKIQKLKNSIIGFLF